MTRRPNAKSAYEKIDPMNDQPVKVRRMRRPNHKPSSPGRRLHVNWPAELRCGSLRIACQVIDISIAGAKLKLNGVLPRNIDKAWLIVEPLGPIDAKLVWRDCEIMGVCFLKDQPEIARLQMRRFDPAAWLDAPDADPAGPSSSPKRDVE